MKSVLTRLIIIIGVVVLAPRGAMAYGVPFLRNYSAAEYGAHNRNSDIVIGDNGMVFVANFEGLLYYDYTEWHIIHTPGITRVNTLFRDSKGTIWAGGYRFFGKLTTDEQGRPRLKSEKGKKEPDGEVFRIWEQGGEVYYSYAAQQQPQTLTLDKNLIAVKGIGDGLDIANADGKTLYEINEVNGLCSNNIAHIAYDGHGTLWGATDNGIFAIGIPSLYTHITTNEGLKGEVLCIGKYKGEMYVGTLNGLFHIQGAQARRIPEITHACWELTERDGQLLAATSEGLFSMSQNGSVRQLNTVLTRSLLSASDGVYTGEQDGVYKNDPDGHRTPLCKMKEAVTQILEDKDGTLWIKTIHGQIWYKKKTDTAFAVYEEGETATLVIDGKKEVSVVHLLDNEPFPYPAFSYTDHTHTLWLTDNNSRHLYSWKDGKQQSSLDELLYPLGNETIRAMYADEQNIWIGTALDLIIIDRAHFSSAFQDRPRLMIRSVTLNSDSVLWGGFGECPEMLPMLESNERNMHLTFSLSHINILKPAYYRYRVDGGNWSAWSEQGMARLFNQPSGSHLFEVQALDPLGHLTDIVELSFTIRSPFYARWYMVIVYVLLLAWLVYNVMQWRLRKLEQDKQRLESIVQQRTAEVVSQKDEIEEKSKRLEQALADLNKAQGELIRQEKMATVGKLTQGLIDRILNPLNYINNFSKLSEGLVKDVEANIEDEKDKMDEENYEDTMDVLNMLQGNLRKVGEHGQNTTRTLKAMEEMLKDRTGGMIQTNLTPILRQDCEMLKKYYADDISKYHIAITTELPEQQILITGNADQLSKTVMSMLNNAVYAVVKKAQKQSYQPEIAITATLENKQLRLSIRDNGIGIEQTIIGKVFDPFFTTKTTGEAAGVGLYLSREIIQNHNGDIEVQSVKDHYTEFIITLPVLS